MTVIEKIQTTEVDGVRTLWTNASRPFTAVLMFRVGWFDETLRTRGITHLTEHLSLAPLKDTELTYNGAVEGFKTLVVAAGHPDRVGSFLNAVCRNLSDLPTNRLDIESGILQREADSSPGMGYPGQICAAYFGPRGPGLVDYKELGLSWLETHELRAWAARYFTKSNAVLALTGPPSSGWELPLPEGKSQPLSVPERSIPAPESPVLLEKQEHGVSWGALVRVPRPVIEPAVMTSVQILSKRLQDRLRHDLGRVYSVSDLYWRLDEDYVYTHLGVDSDTEHSREVATEFHRVVTGYVESGPTGEELERQTRTFERQLADFPDQLLRTHLLHDAEAALCGWEPTASASQVVDKLNALEPDAVRERFVEAYRQSFMVADLPEGTLDTRAEPETSPPLDGKDFTRRYLRKAHGLRTVRIGRDGLSVRTERGWLVARTSEIEVVLTEGRLIHLVTRRMEIQFDVANYRRGTEMEQLLRRTLGDNAFLPSRRASAGASPAGTQSDTRWSSSGWDIVAHILIGATVLRVLTSLF